MFKRNPILLKTVDLLLDENDEDVAEDVDLLEYDPTESECKERDGKRNLDFGGIGIGAGGLFDATERTPSSREDEIGRNANGRVDGGIQSIFSLTGSQKM